MELSIPILVILTTVVVKTRVFLLLKDVNMAVFVLIKMHCPVCSIPGNVRAKTVFMEMVLNVLLPLSVCPSLCLALLFWRSLPLHLSVKVPQKFARVISRVPLVAQLATIFSIPN